jgi:hypothetical protein
MNGSSACLAPKAAVPAVPADLEDKALVLARKNKPFILLGTSLQLRRRKCIQLIGSSVAGQS